MHVEMENVIKKLEQYIKDDEVTYEFDDAIEEKYPFTDFGMPGEIVHYMEWFYRHGYEELLMKSIERRPTIHTLFMMNRLINGGGDREFYMALLKKVTERTDIEKEIRDVAQEYIDFQNEDE